MQFKGLVSFVSETFAYVMVNNINIYFILTLSEPNFSLPSMNSDVLIKKAHIIDERNIFLCKKSVWQITETTHLSGNNKAFLKELLQVIKLKKFGILDIIKFHKYYEEIMININFIAMKPPQQILINLLKNISLDERKVHKEECYNCMLTGLRISSLWKYRHKKPNVIDGFNSWSFYIYNSEAAEKLLVLFSINKRYGQLQISDMHHSMICFVPNILENNLTKALNKVIVINKFVIITEIHADFLVNYAVFDLQHVSNLSNSMMNLSIKLDINSPICTSSLNLLESNLLNIDEEKPENFTFTGFIKFRITDFKKKNSTLLRIDDVILNGCPNELYGIVPQMKVLVKNACISDGKILYKEGTKIHLLSYINPICTLDLYNLNWWLESSNVISDINDVLCNTFVIINAITIHINAVRIKWNDVILDETDCEKWVDVSIMFRISTTNAEFDAVTTDVNLLKIMVNVTNFRFRKWCEEFACLQDYSWTENVMHENNVARTDRYRYALDLLIDCVNILYINNLKILCKKLQPLHAWHAIKVVTENCAEY